MSLDSRRYRNGLQLCVGGYRLSGASKPLPTSQQLFWTHASLRAIAWSQRTFGLDRRFYGMSDTAVAAKKTVEMGKKQILDQCLRVERQLRLIARHERDGNPDLVADAVRMLAEMERALARMRAHYAKAHERLADVTIDESSLAKVERDTPM
jgi:hypothetical protein